MLNRRISAELSKRLSKPWTPSFCRKDNVSWSGTKPRTWHREVSVKLSLDKTLALVELVFIQLSV